ncbi:MAG: YerC/YecD family TrpR-related protein [Gaiellaceae bacterium]
MASAEGSHEWRTAEIQDLCRTIASLRTEAEAGRFLRDLCTLAELEAMSHRWHAARLLDQGRPYVEIAKTTGASTATVTRVAQWLRYGEGGYRLALDRRKRRSSKST